jgi:hypothetical protein
MTKQELIDRIKTYSNKELLKLTVKELEFILNTIDNNTVSY